MLTTTASYRVLASDMTKSLDRTAASPQVEKESAYYLANIPKVKSIDDFIANTRLFTYAMKAYGLSDMTYAKAFMRKVLEGGIDDKQSFANSLSDKRYRDFAAAFNFQRYGDIASSLTNAGQGTVDNYVQQTLEENAGEQNEGVRLALYFQRKAPGITDALDILADPALLKVVQTALSIPAASGAQDIDKQATMIESRLKISDLQDPKLLDKFLTRFTSLYDVQNSTATSSPSVILISGPTEAGIGQDLLLSLQNLKLGGG